jgi:hypothetical protein
MSEALRTRRTDTPFAPIQRFPSGKICDERRSDIPLETSALPKVQPGQLWLVELPPTEPAFSPLEYRALTTANVVIYDRALGQAVASVLPLGGYAEPAAADNPVFDMAAERCRRFARDGWSVVRLVDPRVQSGRQRVDKIRRLFDQLLAAERRAEWPILVFANAGTGGYTTGAAEFDELAEMIDTGGFGQSPTLTVIFDAIDTAAAPRFSVASANGLAG